MLPTRTGDTNVSDDVVLSAQAGQAWALRVLYDELAPRVLGYLTARGASEPEDLTSEVFAAVFPRLGTVTGGLAGLRTLTFSVAHARLVDDLRRRSRRPATVPLDVLADPRTAPSAEDSALTELGEQRVGALLAALPVDQRDVLVLRILGDLTVEQCAQVLAKTSGAVKQLQRRGLNNLRNALGSEGVPL